MANRLGVIGAGQLGRMLGMAAGRLGIETTFLDPATNPPATGTGPIISSPFDDADGLSRLAAACDVITYEFENVPVAAVESIAHGITVFPPPAALRCAQDRWDEKRLFDSLHIPIAAYCKVDTQEDLDRAAKILNYPFVLKTRRFGYDGKGQSVVRNSVDARNAWQELGAMPLIAEQWISFDREVSIIGARRPGGQTAVYPLTENQHIDGILRTSRAPAADPVLLETGRGYLCRLLEHLDYVGVLALELFVSGDSLLANEFAPRVHNSGHWTIEGAVTSQFENHLRAIFDMPLGDTSTVGCAGMINLIGSMPEQGALPAEFPYYLHDYGKTERPGRKLGHITLLAEDNSTRDARMKVIESFLTN